jgi:subtilisin family serine protease
MNNLDPRLVHLAFQKSQKNENVISESNFTESQTENSETVDVLLRCRRNVSIDKLRKAGLRTRLITLGTYTIVSGEIQLEALSNLRQLDGVEKIEESLSMESELDISRSNTRVDSLRNWNPAIRGKGVIIGIIDEAIDYTHPDFCKEDGSSRILYLWDQAGDKLESSELFYGREYNNQELTDAIKSQNPFQSVKQDIIGHGTHVAGIAAGNGRGSQEKYIGIAPDADIIVVALKTDNNSSLGGSVNFAEAFNYITKRANTLNLPVVINCSLGTNAGGHSGETVVEEYLNQLLREPSVVVVKSAGNEGDRLIHASGKIAEDEIQEIDLIRQNINQRALLELWHDSKDLIDVALETPDGKRSDFVSLDIQNTNDPTLGSSSPSLFQQVEPNLILISFTPNADNTGDTLTLLEFLPNSQAGTWKLLLKGQNIQVGRYDVWSHQAKKIKFSEKSTDRTRTITIPGTAKQIITVGSYVTRSNSKPEGSISSFSSSGPTRYGLQKPELIAPGEEIISVCSSKQTDYIAKSGTSMSAPHVTGAAALILSVRPGLTCEQVKQILIKSARQDEHTKEFSDNNLCGNGKLDIEAAILWAKLAKFPEISPVNISIQSISWQTNIPTTSSIYLHPDRRQLELGRYISLPIETQFKKDHYYNLNESISGNYYFEIRVYSQDGWLTVDDNNGDFYTIGTI